MFAPGENITDANSGAKAWFVSYSYIRCYKETVGEEQLHPDSALADITLTETFRVTSALPLKKSLKVN